MEVKEEREETLCDSDVEELGQGESGPRDMEPLKAFLGRERPSWASGAPLAAELKVPRRVFRERMAPLDVAQPLGPDKRPLNPAWFAEVAPLMAQLEKHCDLAPGEASLTTPTDRAPTLRAQLFCRLPGCPHRYVLRLKDPSLLHASLVKIIARNQGHRDHRKPHQPPPTQPSAQPSADATQSSDSLPETLPEEKSKPEVETKPTKSASPPPSPVVQAEAPVSPPVLTAPVSPIRLAAPSAAPPPPLGSPLRVSGQLPVAQSTPGPRLVTPRLIMSVPPSAQRGQGHTGRFQYVQLRPGMTSGPVRIVQMARHFRPPPGAYLGTPRAPQPTQRPRLETPAREADDGIAATELMGQSDASPPRTERSAIRAEESCSSTSDRSPPSSAPPPFRLRDEAVQVELLRVARKRKWAFASSEDASEVKFSRSFASGDAREVRLSEAPGGGRLHVRELSRRPASADAPTDSAHVWEKTPLQQFLLTLLGMLDSS